MYRFTVVFVRLVAENVVTDRQTDRMTHKSSTVTLAAHARRGLTLYTRLCQKAFLRKETISGTFGHILNSLLLTITTIYS